MRFITTVLLIILAVFPSAKLCGAQQWPAPRLERALGHGHPAIACSAAELQRLRDAYHSSGLQHDVVTAVVSQADKVIDKPIEFPPRGGQHNQWYQCDACQLGLKTIDDTHHQCSKCGKIYSGEPYDDVIFARKHRLNLENMLNAAWAYTITGETKYAAFTPTPSKHRRFSH